MYDSLGVNFHFYAVTPSYDIFLCRKCSSLTHFVMSHTLTAHVYFKILYLSCTIKVQTIPLR